MPIRIPLLFKGLGYRTCCVMNHVYCLAIITLRNSVCSLSVYAIAPVRHFVAIQHRQFSPVAFILRGYDCKNEFIPFYKTSNDIGGINLGSYSLLLKRFSLRIPVKLICPVTTIKIIHNGNRFLLS